MKKIRVVETVEDVKSEAKSSDEERYYKQMMESPQPKIKHKLGFNTLDRKVEK